MVLAAAALGLALRLYRLGAQSLWVDEAATYLSSAGTPWWVITQRRYDGSVPPLYFLLVNAVLRVGDSEAALRAVSVVAGVLSIPLLYAVARRWIGDAAAALAAVFLALAPFHVWYSQEARAYATLVCLGLAAVRAAQWAADRPGDWRPHALLVALLVAAFYCHSEGLALLPVAAVVLAAGTWPARWNAAWPRRDAGRLALRLAAVLGAAGLLILPGYLRYFTIDRYPTNHTDGSFNPSALAYTLWAFGTGFSLGPSLADFHAAPAARVARGAAGVIGPVLLALAALLALGARAVWRRSPRAFAGVAALAGAPVVLAAAGSVWARYPYNVRYAALAFPAFVVLLAAGVAAVRAAWARAGAAAAVCALAAASLRQYFGDPRYAREDNRGASAFIARVGAVDRDPVVVSASYTSSVLHYYWRGRARRVVPFPGEELHGDTAAMARAAARLLGGEPRIWLFLSRTYGGDEARVLRRYVDACFTRDTSYRGPGVEAIRYERRTVAAPPGCGTPR